MKRFLFSGLLAFGFAFTSAAPERPTTASCASSASARTRMIAKSRSAASPHVGRAGHHVKLVSVTTGHRPLARRGGPWRAAQGRSRARG